MARSPTETGAHGRLCPFGPDHPQPARESGPGLRMIGKIATMEKALSSPRLTGRSRPVRGLDEITPYRIVGFNDGAVFA